MPAADLIIHNAGQLVTCASNGTVKRGSDMLDVGLITDGAVAVVDGKIAAVGLSAEILGSYSSDEVIDAEGSVICPGFVDPHTHIVYAGDRLNEFELKIKGADYLEIMTSGGGINSTVKQTRTATFDHLVKQSSKRLDRMLTCGTTTCEIKTGYGLDAETELKMLAVIEQLDKTHAISIVPTFLAAHTVPLEFKDRPEAYVDLICSDMLPLAWKWYEQSHFKTAGTPFFCDVFAEKSAFDIEQSHRVLAAARGLGFGIKAHVDQFNNLGGSRLGIELEAVSIDHLDAISDVEIEQLAASETVGIVIPTENFNAGKAQFANARKMIDSGCAVAISTDYNPGSAPCPSQPMAMAIACRYQKLLPQEALNAVTINASCAIGLGHQLGSIEVGKRGDLCIFESTDYREIAYEFGGNLLRGMITNGQGLSVPMG